MLPVTTINTHSVQVTWRAPAQPNGVLISYTVTYNIDGGSFLNANIPYNGSVVSYHTI